MNLFPDSAIQQRHEPNFLAQLQQQFPDSYVIPEGGSNALAIQGCREILTKADLNNYDVFCCAVGTGGTLSGRLKPVILIINYWVFSAER